MRRLLSMWLVLGGITRFPVAFAAAEELSAAPARGHIVFQTDFEGERGLEGWTGLAALEPGYLGGQAAKVTAGIGGESRGSSISRALPVNDFRGCTVRGTAMIRAENVSARPNPWNGIKMMLVIESRSGNAYPQAPLGIGTFDWQPATFTAPIPADATGLRLVLGLEEVTGAAWFDNFKLTIAKPPLATPPPRLGPRYKGHDLPRLRGAMIHPNINAEGLRVLGRDWNANLIRWQLIRGGASGRPSSLGDYDDWLEGELKKLDAALPLCGQFGLRVVVDLHSPPGGKGTSGGYIGSDDRLFTDPKCQEKFVEIWRRMAVRYQKAKPIWGYDLANEPVEEDIGEGCEDWQGLALRAAQAIRAVDPDRTIIVEPAGWGSPEALRDLVPLPVSNVVYSVHMYIPHAFTHQRLSGEGPSYGYPGDIKGRHWDRAALERALQPVVEFQQRYNVHFYIGEFSAIRWAPGQSGCRYLADVIDICESHDWDWSYHAFREWQGWSVEHGPDPSDTRPAASPTDRQRLLQDWFARNRKPPSTRP